MFATASVCIPWIVSTGSTQDWSEDEHVRIEMIEDDATYRYEDWSDGGDDDSKMRGDYVGKISLAHEGNILDNINDAMRVDRGKDGDDGEEEEGPAGKAGVDKIVDVDTSFSCEQETKKGESEHSQK